ncbi:MAG: hypothetical protein FWF80_00050 [Defluviitaleaceae bacterium]|nr:hypothetical protein [Defluviitaleaceae bacterium]
MEEKRENIADGSGLLFISGTGLAIAAVFSMVFLLLLVLSTETDVINLGIAAVVCVFGIILGVFGIMRRNNPESATLLYVLCVVYIFALPYALSANSSAMSILFEAVSGFEGVLSVVGIVLNILIVAAFILCIIAPILFAVAASKNSPSGKTMVRTTGIAIAVILPIMAAGMYAFIWIDALYEPSVAWFVLLAARVLVCGYAVFLGIMGIRFCNNTTKGFVLVKLGVLYILLELIMLFALGQFSLAVGGLELGIFMLFAMAVTYVIAVLFIIAASKNSDTVENFFRVVLSTTTCVACEAEYDAEMKSCPQCAHR